MGPRITIVGGGSYQWTPKLLVDFVNTPALHDAHLVLHDIDPAPLPRMVDLAHHLADVRGITLTASGTTDRGAALDGADFVVVNISTGGFASMRHDLEIPERHGVRQTVGDSVGPGGVLRALRNIPVFLDSAGNVIDTEPGQSRYGALAAAMRERIVAGEWPPGSAIPAEHTLAAEHGVALGTMRRLTQARIASEAEFLTLIARERLAATGLGFVDVHLLASCRTTPGTSLWSRDKRLARYAEQLGVGWPEP